MRALSLLGFLAVGCGAEEPPSIEFTSPAPGSSFTRDALGTNGALVASIPLALDIGGDVARVAITIGESEVGDATGGSQPPSQL